MIEKLKYLWSQILNLPILKQILDWSKRYSPPGFSEVPIYYILKFIYNEATRDNITTRANSVAFSFFLAIFPAIIFLFTLLPLMPFTENYTEMLSNSLNEILPKNAHDYLFGIINDIASIKREGLLSVGFILAVFFASSGMLTLMFGFDKSYNLTFKERGYLKKRLVALLLTVQMVILLIASIVLIILGNTIVNYLLEQVNMSDKSSYMIFILRWLIVFLLIYTGMTIIYKYGPSMYKRTPFINPGAIIGTILSILTSLGFAYFVNNFGQFNELYGSIGALIVIMIWLQFNAFIILVGFELNASIAVNRDILMESKSDDLSDLP